jgi:hypothetical protein
MFVIVECVQDRGGPVANTWHKRPTLAEAVDLAVGLAVERLEQVGMAEGENPEAIRASIEREGNYIDPDGGWSFCVLDLTKAD